MEVGGGDSIHLVSSESLLVRKIHLNLNLGRKHVSKHSVVHKSADSEARLPGFESQLLLLL